MPDNNSYLGNNLLKGLGVQHKFKKKEIEEYIKKYKRKIIQTPNSLKIRPTSSRMRKSIFDVLSHSKYLNEEIYNTKVLDVFAGSGMMGLECLSRGAIYCKFIDNSNQCIRIINKNILL